MRCTCRSLQDPPYGVKSGSNSYLAMEAVVSTATIIAALTWTLDAFVPDAPDASLPAEIARDSGMEELRLGSLDLVRRRTHVGRRGRKWVELPTSLPVEVSIQVGYRRRKW